MKTEYLVSVNNKENICTSKQAFDNFLMANKDIQIINEKIKYKDFLYSYTNQENRIENTDVTYYHITIGLEKNEGEISQGDIDNYELLLRDIRTILLKITSEIEILWDDVSFYYSRKSYPLIYQIENLMRKLLTKFMLINVGTKWEKENIPSKISKSQNRGKEVNLGSGILYKLDFIELSNFLFDEYALNKNIDNLKKETKGKESIPCSVIDEFLNKSNWERYFKDIVQVENEYFRKKWEELYEMRCKIAHNNMFTKTNYKTVEGIISDLMPSIETALLELDKIKVGDDVKERVTESFAIISTEYVGEFILEYNKLSSILMDMLAANNLIEDGRNNKYSLSKTMNMLLENSIISDEEYKKIKLITFDRNKIVHEYNDNIDEENLKRGIKEIKSLVSELNRN